MEGFVVAKQLEGILANSHKCGYSSSLRGPHRTPTLFPPLAPVIKLGTVQVYNPMVPLPPVATVGIQLDLSLLLKLRKRIERGYVFGMVPNTPLDINVIDPNSTRCYWTLLLMVRVRISKNAHTA